MAHQMLVNKPGQRGTPVVKATEVEFTRLFCQSTEEQTGCKQVLAQMLAPLAEDVEGSAVHQYEQSGRRFARICLSKLTHCSLVSPPDVGSETFSKFLTFLAEELTPLEQTMLQQLEQAAWKGVHGKRDARQAEKKQDKKRRATEEWPLPLPAANPTLPPLYPSSKCARW